LAERFRIWREHTEKARKQDALLKSMGLAVKGQRVEAQ
jgi:hypothetical protein